MAQKRSNTTMTRNLIAEKIRYVLPNLVGIHVYHYTLTVKDVKV